MKLHKGAPANASPVLTITLLFLKIHIVQFIVDWDKTKGWGIVIQKWPFDPYRMAYIYFI